MGSEMMFLGQKQDKVIKSNNFTQTCNRFSQFLKERRSLANLDAFKSFASSELEFKGANKEVSEARNCSAMNNNSSLKKNMEKEKMSLELFPLTNSQTTSDSAVRNSTNNFSDFRELPNSKEDPENTTSPSMTIFYGGRVLVFNELPEDKAQEIMSLASHGTLMNSQTQAQTQTQALTQTQNSYNMNTVAAQHHLKQGVVSHEASSLSDMPIARRVSLHRFMEKRKHRIAASAPYHIHQNPSVAKESDSHPHKFNRMRSVLYEQQQLELKL